ncbi:hypothetical protein L484_012366 [Morus notabilis]|uniref:Vacuole membrane protein 1 n=1 Tax=Morus notabilis TaxID=981085 RepID=W9SMR9_9ROSA|nr:hypothetical protein L484_012366 [Morus notabilis]
MLLSTLALAVGVLLVTIDGPHEKHVEELVKYFRFGLWWMALGVASSIGLVYARRAKRGNVVGPGPEDGGQSKIVGLVSEEGPSGDLSLTCKVGSGLHTFVLYLGPHIALFTIKAMKCGRVDLKSAPYDTIQLKRGPSWLDKDCSEFGPPLFPLVHGLRVPLSSILPQVQVEAILWGVGTAIGELPPYFLSRADFFPSYNNLKSQDLYDNVHLLFDLLLYEASISGNRVDAMEDLDDSSNEDNGFWATHMRNIRRWLLSHSQHLNFITILILASIPNPLFDLAGIMCGQFGIPFWKFFLSTLIGKAIIKTHIQTVFIIAVCNNQLLNWIENELIWVLSFIPGLASALPNLTAKLDAVKEKYLTSAPVSSDSKVKKWDFSFASVWSTVVWLMLMNFFVKIVNATAQRYLKKQQDKEIAALTKKT